MEQIKIFLDTNVVLDYLSGRMNDGKAARLVQVGRNTCYKMCISILTAANVIYISRKILPGLSPEKLSRLFEILPQDVSQWNNAMESGMTDFEDALQCACAVENRCLCIVSRDKRYLDCTLPVFDPSDFLDTVVNKL